MTFEAALCSELETIPDLKGKVLPIRAPEGKAAPYLVYVTGVGEYDKTLTGFHKSRSVSVELNVIHFSTTQLRALARQVQELVMSFERRRLATTGPYVSEVVFEGDGVEMYESRADLYRKVINLKVYYREE